MINIIELASYPGSMASNWKLVYKKINLAPIDLLALLQVKT